MPPVFRAHVATLGCPKNEVDSRTLSRGLVSRGAELTSDPAQAGVIIVNTCGFIADAKEESINALLSFVDRFPETPVIGMGCLVQRYRTELAEGISEVRAWFGVDEINEAADFVAREVENGRMAPAGETGGSVAAELNEARSFGYVKVSDGCDHLCSFCAIPLIKGSYVAAPLDEVLEEVRGELLVGAREIVLVGQDTSLWQDGSATLSDLLAAVAREPQAAWVRLMYVHPENLDDRLLEALAGTPKVCRYLDIPFQHAAPAVLARMRRSGSGEGYLALLDRARRLMPDVSVRSTFIVGFPGESDDDFEELLAFVGQAGIAHAGAFAFSPEEGTEAYGLTSRIPVELVRERLGRLTGLLVSQAEMLNRSRVGKTVDVIVDSVATGEGGVSLLARTQGQAPEVDGLTYVEGAIPRRCRAGDIIPVTLTGAFGFDYAAEWRSTESP